MMSDSSDIEDPPSPPESQTELLNELTTRFKELIQLGHIVLWRDPSSGDIQPISDRDRSLEEWLENQTVDLQWISPNPCVLKAGENDNCIEGQDFEKNERIQNRGPYSENEVWRVSGKNADVPHILKVIPKTNFRREEVLAHRYLQSDSDFISKLMLVRRDGNNWALHFELVHEGEPLSKVHNEIKERAVADPELVPLVPQFALCYLHFMLKVWQYMCQKGWAHTDLTADNILVSKETLIFVVIDFGSAERLCLKDEVSSRKVMGYSEQDYCDILHWFSELTAAGNHTEIILVEEKEKTVTLDLFRQCQKMIDQYGTGYESPAGALRLSQIKHLLFPGEQEFRCFLEAMVLTTKGNVNLKGQLEGLLEGNSPALILDMRRTDIGLLTSEDVQNIDKTLQEWRVLHISSSHTESNLGSAREQFLKRLMQAVSGTADHDCEHIPPQVRQSIDAALEVKMTKIIKKTMSKLFPAYYEEHAVGGQLPFTETSQQDEVLRPRHRVSQAVATASQPWSSQQGVPRAPVAASQPRSSQQGTLQAPVAASPPFSSQNGVPQVAVHAQYLSDPPASEDKPEAVSGAEAEATTLSGEQDASSEGAVAIRHDEDNGRSHNEP